MIKTEYIGDLLKRGIGSVFWAKLLQKALVFVGTTLVVRLVSVEDYALFAYAGSIMGVLMPLGGLGLDNGLMYYGSRLQSASQKRALFWATLRIGVLYSFILIVALWLMRPLICRPIPSAVMVFVVLSLQLVSHHLMGEVFAYMRILHLNRLFSIFLGYSSILQFIMAVGLTYFYGVVGYAFSFVIYQAAVFLTFVIVFRGYRLASSGQVRGESKKSLRVDREFHIYSFVTGMSNILSILIFSLDIILLTHLLGDDVVLATYKVSGILAFNLVFLPAVIFTTDFTHLSQASLKRPQSVGSYYWRYLKTFGWMFVALVGILYLFGPSILLIFGQEYVEGLAYYRIFLVGILGALLFRVPMGNILAAIGWSRANLVIAAVVLLLNLVLNYFAILRHGALGAAIVTSSLLWLSGLMGLAVFYYWYRRQGP